MRKLSFIIMIIFISTILFSCEEKGVEEETYIDVDQTDMTLFTKHSTGNIGDVMPFYDEGKWHIFYLHDSRPNPGFHPWYRFSTTNFHEFEDHGEAIPVVHDRNHPELALGTGSVVKKDNVYHAFYTSWNGRLNPKENIMHAISMDNMETWEKQPGNTIDPRDFGFETNDFRDPHVVYIPEKEVYYMLFTARYLGSGAVGYLESTDLINWSKVGNGIFFVNNHQNGTQRIDSNLECPTLVYFNGFWYLTFSDQWPDRVTHYLYTSNLDQPWIKPASNIFDGAGLYAGKIATDGERLLLMGWVSHNFNRADEFGWGGNFIAHELRQLSNGQLYVGIIDELNEKISNKQELVITETNMPDVNLANIKFTKTGNLQYVVFNELEGINKITGILNISSIEDIFGIFFNYLEDEASFHYDIFPTDFRMSFYRGHFTERTPDRLYTTNKFYNTSNQLSFTLLFEEASDADGSIVTFYIQGQMALTARMFLRYNVNFGFYGLNSDVTITNLQKFK